MDQLSDYKYIDFNELIIEDEIDRSNLAVYKGKYKKNIVAIKEYIINEDGDLDDNFINELYIGSKAYSERMLKIYGYSYNEDKTIYYLIMDYVNSGSLYHYINKDKYAVNTINNGRETGEIPRSNYNMHIGKTVWNYTMNEEVKFSIAISVLKAVKSMYNLGIIHADLKPHNLVIHDDGENLYVKIIDYGTCKYKPKTDKTSYIVGTTGFYAPEQEMEGILNHKSDIYSIGVTLIELWTGHIFKKNIDDFNIVRNEVLKSLRIIKGENPELEKVLRKCIDLKYKKRPDIYQLLELFTNLSQAKN